MTLGQGPRAVCFRPEQLWGAELELDVLRDPGRLSGPQCPHASVGELVPKKVRSGCGRLSKVKQTGRVDRCP